jgi:UDP-glucose 4-epimerase
MKCLVTGAGGFIGSNLVDTLLAEGHEVTGVDNFSTGLRHFLHQARENPRFTLLERDLLDPAALLDVLGQQVEHVFHLAANADVKDGLQHPRRDLEQNTIVTSNVLEAMRATGVRAITFASTGSVYGEAAVIPTPETCPFPVQTSLYAASKLACEALISAYCEGYGFEGTIFRFVSILGERYTHGHVFDFVKSLRRNPDVLRVLGNGKQRKSYLHIGDCVAAILHVRARRRERPVEIYNLGTDEFVDVDQSIGIICDELGAKPKRDYAGGDRGWVGDNPFIFLDCTKLRATGWTPAVSIADGVRRTVRYLVANPWVFEERHQPR